MSQERVPGDYGFLAVFAGAMALAILIALFVAATKQNQFGWVINVNAYGLDGSQEWDLELDAVRNANPSGGGVLVAQESAVEVLGDDGSIELTISIPGVKHVAGNGDVVVVGRFDGTGDAAVAFDAQTGEELWRLPNRSLVEAAGQVTTLSTGHSKDIVETSTGRALHNIAGRRVSVVTENDAAAAVVDNRLIVVTPTGTVELANDRLQGTTVAQIEPAAIVVYGNGSSEGREVISVDRRTGDVIWSKRVRDYKPATQSHYYIGRADRFDAMTGKPVIDWIQATSGGVVTGHVDRGLELVNAVDRSVRLFWVDGGTVAVDSATDAVLWERPGQLAANIRGGIVRFNQAGRMELVNANTGQTLADMRSADRNAIRIDGGTALIAYAGRITVVAAEGGGAEQIDKVLPDAEVLATSSRYGVVVDGRQGGQVVMHVYDYATGRKILEEPILANTARVMSGRLGDRVVFTSGNRTFQVSLEPDSLGETRPSANRVRGYRVNPSLLSELIVLDASKSSLLWARNISERHVIDVVGETIVVSEYREKHLPEVAP